VESAVRPEPLEMYLQTVRDHLQSLSPEDSSEIIRELRSHVLDRVKGDLSNATVSATLTRLGQRDSPEIDAESQDLPKH
jgi:hypothetical protein